MVLRIAIFNLGRHLIAVRDGLQFVDVAQRLPSARSVPLQGRDLSLHHVLPRWLVESLPHIAHCVYLAISTSDARVRRLWCTPGYGAS
jgi:hypothetical protein